MFGICLEYVWIFDDICKAFQIIPGRDPSMEANLLRRSSCGTGRPTNGGSLYQQMRIALILLNF